MSLIALSRRIRHAPGLRHADRLWSILRPLYHRAIDPFGRGVRLELGGRVVRMPPELLMINPDWSSYERESFAALGAWLDRHPAGATLLDIGSSVGVVTSFALQLAPALDAVAFDSDLISLRAMEAVVPARLHHRLRRIQGLLGQVHASGDTLASAEAATRRRLPALDPRRAIPRSHFICFGEDGATAVPQHSLDALFPPAPAAGPLLLKCDVEGAELLVLAGATRLLAERRPDLLLSVHPVQLPRFHQTPADVAAFLTRFGYTWRLLSRDHEEHWLAEPRR